MARLGVYYSYQSLNPHMKKNYISPNAYSKKTGIPKDTVMRWALNGKIKDIKKVSVTKILINEDYKV